MDANLLTARRVQKIFAPHLSLDEVVKILSQKIPRPTKRKWGGIERNYYPLEKVMELGQELCPWPLWSGGGKVVTFFTTKGGVLKTTLAFNLARVSALYGLKVLAIGLDLQGDLTNTLGNSFDEGQQDDQSDLSDAIERLDQTPGLYDYFLGRKLWHELVCSSDIPNLFYIPETPELVALNEAISQLNRREYWLKEKVLSQLKSQFDLIILDCGPHWNKLTTNALVASDLLVSPVECKINNFRNFQFFHHFLKEFSEDMNLPLEVLFVPTKYALGKKLSREIYQWYQSQLSNCSLGGLRENLASEEAQALKISLLEHDPDGPGAQDMRGVLENIFGKLVANVKKEESLWPSA